MQTPVFKIHMNKRFYLVESKIISKQDKLSVDNYLKASEFIRENSSEFKIDDDMRKEKIKSIDIDEIEMKEYFKIIAGLKQEYDFEGLIKKYFNKNNVMLTINEVKSFLNLC